MANVKVQSSLLRDCFLRFDRLDGSHEGSIGKWMDIGTRIICTPMHRTVLREDVKITLNGGAMLRASRFGHGTESRAYQQYNCRRIEGSGVFTYLSRRTWLERIESNPLMWSTRSSQPLLPGRLDDTGSGESTRWFPWFVESIRCPCTLFLFRFSLETTTRLACLNLDLRRSFQVTRRKSS